MMCLFFFFKYIFVLKLNLPNLTVQTNDNNKINLKTYKAMHKYTSQKINIFSRSMYQKSTNYINLFLYNLIKINEKYLINMKDTYLFLLLYIGAIMFQYYIKIVPTLYQRRDSTIFSTNQFSVTKHKVNYYLYYVKKKVFPFKLKCDKNTNMKYNNRIIII